MAARINTRHQDMVREKIRASQLINRLEGHVFGEVDMQASQVTAALGLLKKCLPDLSESKADVNVGGGLIEVLAGLGRGSSGNPPVA